MTGILQKAVTLKFFLTQAQTAFQPIFCLFSFTPLVSLS
jgi:hypothetical protein